MPQSSRSLGFARIAFASALVGLFACSSSSGGGTTGGDDTGGTPGDDTGTPGEDTTPPEEDTTPPLEYPPGPYGLKLRNVFPNLSFKGYKQGTGEWVDMSMLDYFDPDDRFGIKGIYFVVGAQWCPPCNTEAGHLSVWWPGNYKDRGARFVTAIIEDSARKPATQLTVDQWVKRHKINFDIMLDDTSASLPKTGTVGLPYNYVINPRDMTIIRIVQGIDPAVKTGCTTDENCCKTAVSPDTCAQDYSCSIPMGTCLTPSMLGPIPGLDALMVKNGATTYDTGLKK